MVTGKHETVYTFGWYLRKMIADTRAQGATPILLTLTERNTWQEGRIDCPSDTYRRWDLADGAEREGRVRRPLAHHRGSLPARRRRMP